MVKAENNIPIPPRRQGCKGKYPWEGLEIGGSFLVEGSKLETRALIPGLYATAKRRGIKIEVRIDPEGRGHRCWRVK